MGGVERAAFREAERLGHDFVGPEHGLLAILRGNPTDPARLALEDVGVTADMVERLLARMITASPLAVPEHRSGTSPNPAWYRAFGRAEGFAAALGPGTVRPVDLLFGLLWGQWRFVDDAVASREAIVEALARHGAILPSAPLPELERLPRFTQHADIPRASLGRVLTLLAEQRQGGSGPIYGFNHDGAERAWVDAEDGIDLQAIVDAALADDPA
jgi:hypothetical protein